MQHIEIMADLILVGFMLFAAREDLRTRTLPIYISMGPYFLGLIKQSMLGNTAQLWGGFIVVLLLYFLSANPATAIKGMQMNGGDYRVIAGLFLFYGTDAAFTISLGFLYIPILCRAIKPHIRAEMDAGDILIPGICEAIERSGKPAYRLFCPLMLPLAAGVCTTCLFKYMPAF